MSDAVGDLFIFQTMLLVSNLARLTGGSSVVDGGGEPLLSSSVGIDVVYGWWMRCAGEHRWRWNMASDCDCYLVVALGVACFVGLQQRRVAKMGRRYMRSSGGLLHNRVGSYFLTWLRQFATAFRMRMA